MSSFVDGVQLDSILVPRENPESGQVKQYKLRFRYVERHTRKPPVVVLHGGPSLPSNYLYNLADLGFRSMLFYDQLGCGHSEHPKEGYNYSPTWAVRDLETIIDTVLGHGTPYHLYGHSYGGCLAFEFLQTCPSSMLQKCRSVTLSSAPIHVRKVREVQQALVKELGAAQFAKQHVCRLQPVPSVLQAAYQYPGRKWIGMQAFADYQVSTEIASPIYIPCLALQGEYDFVDNAAGWKQYFPKCRVESLPDCSHHGLYENPALYAETLRNFWSENDY